MIGPYGGVALISYSRGVGTSSFTSSFSSFTWNMVVEGHLLYLLEHELAAFINCLFDHLFFYGLGDADLAVEQESLCWCKGVSSRFYPFSTTKASD